MGNSKRCTLRSTSNSALTWIIGREGDLSIDDKGVFHFKFKDDNGVVKDLTSGVVSCLGSLEHPASKEIGFQTKTSIYVFDKTELEHGLWGAERGQLDAQPTITYEEYNSLRNSVEGFRRGDNQRLTLSEQQQVMRKWEKVNRDIKDGKTTILPPGQKVSEAPEKIPYEKYSALRSQAYELKQGKNPMGLSPKEREDFLQKWEKLNKDIHAGKVEIAPTKERSVSNRIYSER